MRTMTRLAILALASVLAAADQPAAAARDTRIVLLHHSTGGCVWEGGVARWFDEFNRGHGTRYRMAEQVFPKSSPYGWNNYPYDYWNIWVAHAGDRPFKEEPTLELLTKQYEVIVLKHCFPVSSIAPDDPRPDVASERKTLANYRLQYDALKAKMRSFPTTRFIVWTPPALVQGDSRPEEAKRATEFSDWVKKTWDEPGDNIFVWDFRALETKGGPYLTKDLAASPTDSHPGAALSATAATSLAQRIVDVIEGRGDGARR